MLENVVEKNSRVLAVQAQGTLGTRGNSWRPSPTAPARWVPLARQTPLARWRAPRSGTANWRICDLTEAQLPRWRMRADSKLDRRCQLPCRSRLRSDPLWRFLCTWKWPRAPTIPHSFGRTLATACGACWLLRRKPVVGWSVDRAYGCVSGTMECRTMPTEQAVFVRGRISQPRACRHMPSRGRDSARTSLPTIRAQIVAHQMAIADRHYDEVSLQAERTAAGTNLLLDSAPELAGIVRWPTPERGTHTRGLSSEAQPVELHFARG